MPSPLPAPLPPWARWLLQLTPFISAGLQAGLDYLEEMRGADATTPDEWRRYVYHFRDVSNIDDADEAVTTFDIVNITGGAIDNSWTEGDYVTVDGQLDALVGAYAAFMANSYKVTRCAVYRMQFNPLPPPGVPLGDDKPFTKSGAPVRDRVLNVTGGSSVRLPSQISMTATELTPYRRHWGRNYWPFIGGSSIDTTGHIASATCTALATAYNGNYGSLQSNDFFPVVPVTQIEKAPARGLLGVEGVKVDNVFDVQRRRRLHTTTFVAEALAGELLERTRGLPA